MAFEIYDKKGNLLETIDDDSQFDVILKEGESNPDIQFFQWDVDMVERLAEESDDDSDIRLLKKI